MLTPHWQSTQQCWEDVGGQWAGQGLCSPGTSVCSLILAWLPSPTRLPLGDCTSPFALSPAFLLAQLGEMGRHPN